MENCDPNEHDTPLPVLPVGVNPYTPPHPITTEPPLAEVVLIAPPPRIWLTILVLIGAILTMWMVGSTVPVLFAMVDLGPDGMRDSGTLTSWLKNFIKTPMGLLLAVLPGQLTLLGIGVAAAVCSPEPTGERLGLVRGRMPLWSWPLFALATPVIAVATSLLLSVFIEDVGDRMRKINEMFGGRNGAAALWAFGTATLVPGFCEELMFRGYAQTRLLKRWSVAAAILFPSTLFAIAHLNPMQVVGVFPLGIWLGIVSWRSGSLWPAVLCHIANNALAVGSVYMAVGGQPNPMTGFFMLGLLAASSAALIASIVLMFARQPLPADVPLGTDAVDSAPGVAISSRLPDVGTSYEP